MEMGDSGLSSITGLPTISVYSNNGGYQSTETLSLNKWPAFQRCWLINIFMLRISCRAHALVKVSRWRYFLIWFNLKYIMSLYTSLSTIVAGMTERGHSGFLGKGLMGRNVIEFSLCASHKTTTCLADYAIYCCKI